MECSRPLFVLGVFGAMPWILGYAQAATLSGSVAEEAEAVGEAEIVLVNADNSVVLDRTRSEPDGSFRFIVEPGRFNVGAFKSDYTTVWIRGIAVDASDVNVRLDLEPAVFADAHSGIPDDDGCD